MPGASEHMTRPLRLCRGEFGGNYLYESRLPQSCRDAALTRSPAQNRTAACATSSR
jgi:hypothetical protein